MLRYSQISALHTTRDDSGHVNKLDLTSQTYRIINLRAHSSQLTQFSLLEYYDALRGVDVVFVVSTDKRKELTQSDFMFAVSGEIMRKILCSKAGLKVPNAATMLNPFYLFRELSTKPEFSKPATFPMPKKCIASAADNSYDLLVCTATELSSLRTDVLLPLSPILRGTTFVPEAVNRMEPLFAALLRSATPLLSIMNILNALRSHTMTVDVLRTATGIAESWRFPITLSMLLFFASMASIECRAVLSVRSTLSASAAWAILCGLLRVMCKEQLPDDNIAMSRLEKFSGTITPVGLNEPRLRVLTRWQNSDKAGVVIRESSSVSNDERSMDSLYASDSLSDSVFNDTTEISASLFVLSQSHTKMRTLSQISSSPLRCRDLCHAVTLLSMVTDAAHLLRISLRTPSRQPAPREYMICSDAALWTLLPQLWKTHHVGLVLSADRSRESLYNKAIRPCMPLYMPWTVVCLDKAINIEAVCSSNNITVLWSVAANSIDSSVPFSVDTIAHCLCWTTIKCVSPDHAYLNAWTLAASLPPTWKPMRSSAVFHLPPSATRPTLPYCFDHAAKVSWFETINTKCKAEAIVRAALHETGTTATSALFVVSDTTLLTNPALGAQTRSKVTVPGTEPCTFGMCDAYGSNMCASALCHEVGSRLRVAVVSRGELPLVFANIWLRYAEIHARAHKPQWLYECNARLTQTLVEVCKTNSALSASLPQYGVERAENTSTSSTWNIPREITDCVYVKQNLSHIPLIDVHASVLLGRLDESLGIAWHSWSKIGRLLYEVNPESEWLRKAFRWWSFKCDSAKFREKDHTGYGAIWEQLTRRGLKGDSMTAMKCLASKDRISAPISAESILEAIART